MNGHSFDFAGVTLVACASGALWWPSQGTLVVSDLHLCKAERMARRGGPMLPPYETRDALARLEAEIRALAPATVICLGDSFDDTAAARALDEDDRLWLTRLMAGRRWIWIEGNHDPGPLDLGGTHLAELVLGPLTFRHVAAPAASREVSGHYHPKAAVGARGGRVCRPCFLLGAERLILPAFGTYTGGLHCTDPVLARLMGPGARAILTGPTPATIPVPA